jgi:acyl phosphate:glycerol-3-phosphate acyltransferase
VTLAVVLLLSYLLGAFPASIVYGKLFRGTDVRQHGSGNAGGTNAWRVLGWRIGVPVIVTDVAKGAVAAGVFPQLASGIEAPDPGTVALLCGLVAVIGHVFPIYTRFRGGKGVATGAGVLFAVAPLPAALALGVFSITVVLSGYVSLASVSAALSLPLSAFLIDWLTQIEISGLVQGLTLGLALFIVYTHRSNLTRLVRREENRFERLQLWRRLAWIRRTRANR